MAQVNEYQHLPSHQLENLALTSCYCIYLQFISDLSDSESDNELAESYTRSPPVFHRESSTVLERRRMKGVQATGETLIIDIPRNASTSSTSTTNSSKESRMYADDGHHHRNTASTHGLTLKRSLKKMISKHNLSQAVPNSPFSSSSGSSKSKGRYTAGPSDTKKGAMSVLLMSQQVSLEGNTVAFLNRFTSSQVRQYLPLPDFPSILNMHPCDFLKVQQLIN